jgi:hypothetical protein
VTRPEDDLLQLAHLQRVRKILDQSERALVARLVGSRVTGIRAAVSSLLCISTETLRVRYPRR